MSMFDPFKIFDPGGEDIFGTKPQIPEAVNYANVLDKAATSNIKLLPKLAELGKLSTEQLLKQLETSMPGFAQMLASGSELISSRLKGNLFPDEEQDTIRRSIENAIGGGYGQPGSEARRNLEYRDLGLDKYRATTEALTSAERWMSAAQNRTFDFSRMFLSPEMAIAGAESGFQRDLLAAGVAAAPDPVARGRYDTELAILGMVLSIYSGGQGYTGQYKAPQYGATGGNNGGGGGGSRSYFGTGGDMGYGDPAYGQTVNDARQGYSADYSSGNSFDALDTAALAGFV